MPPTASRPIAYTVQTFPSLTITFIYREVMALRARGMDVTVFSTWRPKLDELSSDSVDLVEDTFYLFPRKALDFVFAHLYYLLARFPRYVRTLFFLLRQKAAGRQGRLRLVGHFVEAVYLAREMERRQVGHIHAGFASNPANLAFIISQLTGISFSFAAHANGIFADPMMLQEKLAAAKFVIASTRYNKDFLLARCDGIDEDKIKVIYHGVPLEDFAPGENSRAEEEVPTILTVAQFREKKGLPVLVEACRILRDKGQAFKCCIVGDGPQRKHLEQLIDDYDLHDLVQLEGIVFQEHLKAYYQRASVFALPSMIAADGDRDGIPVTLIEVMATGCPVVSTTVSGIPELVEHGRTGLLVPPRDAEALADALLTLLKDKHLRQQMGQASRAKVVAQFDMKDSISRVADLFVNELEGANPS
jgi:colanic acid/amylovoran biosynthesis glycosyltransferase